MTTFKETCAACGQQMRATMSEILRDTKYGDTITFLGVDYRVCQKTKNGWLCQPKGGPITRLTRDQLNRITYTSANAALESPACAHAHRAS